MLGNDLKPKEGGHVVEGGTGLKEWGWESLRNSGWDMGHRETKRPSDTWLSLAQEGPRRLLEARPGATTQQQEVGCPGAAKAFWG